MINFKKLAVASLIALASVSTAKAQDQAKDQTVAKEFKGCLVSSEIATTNLLRNRNALSTFKKHKKEYIDQFIDSKKEKINLTIKCKKNSLTTSLVNANGRVTVGETTYIFN